MIEELPQSITVFDYVDYEREVAVKVAYEGGSMLTLETKGATIELTKQQAYAISKFIQERV
ncbi:hypothetical protein cd3_109 [Carnobacterium phage cd3]|uniref:Uncharacterized protein n=2 Tax=Carnodivirus TaxID=3044682 RepID=A0AAE7SNL1_9CAUD|nr:hypothetical protein [Vagococcus salmoninarum]YP_010676465.1 hypothetical protein PQD68_gp109 [Carnobacterium phage cd2]YP_010676574.1 hypothetical protein PQD69_gp108 [Carnobacterium phage cd4]QXP45319.1 hypothetical protein cd3_109 [Carnobacterium phage cd3]QXP45125.1 hypothetical protein cd2_109 [Carnobacterium phage cd2]QXP45402.1 hypothetical protein cd4_108 [Carnobacterium phage cd4]